MNIKTGYKQTEIGVIPEDWKVCELGDIGFFKNGINKNKEAFGHGSPFINLMDVFGFSSISDTEKFGLIDSTNIEKNMYDLKMGDVIFIRSSVKPTGVGLTAVVLKNLPDTVFSGFLIRFRDTGVLNNDYKKHCFYDENFRRRVIASSSVSANTNINQDSLKHLQFVLPPLPEQTAIAAALSDVDALMGELDKLIAKKHDIKQATMQQLLTGKKRLAGFSGEWEVKRLGEVAELYQPITISAKQFTESGYPVYGANGIVGVYHDFNHESSQVTVTCRGSTCGTVNKTVEQSWITGNAMVINCDNSKDIEKQFLYYLLLNQDLSICITGTGQPQIVRSPLSNFNLSIPSKLEEQTAIATILSDMDADINALQQKRDKTAQLKQGMMQELLTGRIRLSIKE